MAGYSDNVLSTAAPVAMSFQAQLLLYTNKKQKLGAGEGEAERYGDLRGARKMTQSVLA